MMPHLEKKAVLHFPKLLMTMMVLDSRDQALYSLLLKHVVNSSTSWKQGVEYIRLSAECLFEYK